MAPDAMGTPGTVTNLLRRARNGDLQARDELFALVDRDLRRLAASLLSEGPMSRDLDATALVNSACERLLGHERLDADCRRHFFFLLGRAMHDVLVEQARASAAAKRGGDRVRVPLTTFEADGQKTTTGMLDLRDALEDLGKRDPDGARVIQLRFFGGRTIAETAEIMGCSFSAARAHWDYARAWLHERLAGAGDGTAIR